MIINFLIILVCVAADQISKFLVLEYLDKTTTYPIIENVFHFTYVENPGAAFGMLADNRWVFMILSVVGISALIIWLAIEKPKSMWIRTAAAMIAGGGIGNMIDRIAYGYVVDFIDCRFIDFYVFNIADSFVCVGCFMFIIGVIVDEIRTAKKQKLSEACEVESKKDGESHEC